MLSENRGLRDAYESFIMALTIFSLGNLVVGLFAWQPIVEILRTVDAGLCVVFVFDFGLRLFTSANRRRYFFREYGWADLIGSLPVPGLRLARLYRVVTVAQDLRPIRGRLWQSVMRERAGTTLFAVLFLVVVLLEVASSFVLAIEQDAPSSNIRNASDALWWTWVSVTTVGYGDRFPVTDVGRFVGAVTLAVGVGLVGALTGFLANAFLGANAHFTRQQLDQVERVRHELEEIRAELRGLRGANGSDERASSSETEEAPAEPSAGASARVPD